MSKINQNLMNQIEHLLKLLEQNPNDSTLILKLADCYFQLNDLNNAVRCIDILHQLSQNNHIIQKELFNIINYYIKYFSNQQDFLKIEFILNHLCSLNHIEAYYVKMLVDFYANIHNKQALIDLHPRLLIIDYQPADIDLIIQIAQTFEYLRCVSQALALYNLALKINPTHEILLQCFTNFLVHHQLYDINYKICHYAIKIYPNNINLLENLGIGYFSQKKYQEAIDVFNHCLTMPNAENARYSNILSNLGTCYAELGQFDLASQYYQKAIEINPDNALAKTNLAGYLLLNDDYLKGFEYYESRHLVHQQQQKNINLNVKFWNTENNNPDGEIILIYPEQGLGDVIQMSRYLKLLKNFNSKNTLIICCHESLQKLLAFNFIKSNVIDSIILPQELDLYQNKIQAKISFMSLPFLFKTSIHNIPNEYPYLHIDEKTQQFWKDKIYHKISDHLIKPKLKVGIAWQGSKLHQKNEIRNLSNEQVIDILNTFQDDILFFTVHKSDDILVYNNLINFNQDIHDFYDLGALMSQLDLIISVDSAPVHLAGALNLNCWTLIYTPSDWRWSIHNETKSVWYSQNMILFKQKKSQTWEKVIDNIKNSLKNLLDSKNVNF